MRLYFEEVILVDALLLSNRNDGLLVNGSLALRIFSSQFSSNGKNGISAQFSPNSSFEITNSFIGSNGDAGLCILPDYRTRIKILASNFTAHYYRLTILVNIFF